MSEKTKKFTDELDLLIEKGDMLHMAIQHDCYGREFEKQIEKVVGKNKLKDYLKKLPEFNSAYQAWYSETQALVKQVLPDRLGDFVSYYEYPRVRKNIGFQNYMIRDYLQGLQITSGYPEKVIADGKSAIPEFVQQLNIIKAAKEIIESSLMNITSILQADLFDSEIDSARALAKSGFLRAEGAICGVVIEKHLKQVCNIHGISIKKKNPGISDRNQTLRDADIITVPQWRFIQHLADIRNICDHAKDREPTKDEIEDLVTGTDKVLKTVF